MSACVSTGRFLLVWLVHSRPIKHMNKGDGVEVTERGADDAQLLDGLGSLIFFFRFSEADAQLL